MNEYTPGYDTEIQTQTKTTQVTTWHTDYIDWDNYPFDDPAIMGSKGCWSDEAKNEWLEAQKSYLKTCELPGASASNYGGWPRIWQKVARVGMCSCWPYWKPRPTVLFFTHLGSETVDWTSLTGAKIPDEVPA